ncbi:hypothetical protein LDO32_13530 [Luteimonas sp. Y-2-2-4F]|nr:O-antigen ligase family protein [Luteimonas sp. Y-2-2-4F]MCD9032747.1 hypothetical protein [Luteimonas sp. Y-2-2-4F]
MRTTLPDAERQAGIAFVAVALLLALAVTTGGSSQDAGRGVFVLQLASLPALGWATWRQLRGGAPPWPWPWIALAVALFAVPLLQLAPWPAAAVASAGRDALAADLARFGADAPARASLAPGATRGALFLLLPALAVFWLTWALPARLQQRVAWVVVALAMASLLLGILQLGAPAESPLNPYPQWEPAMNGFLANPNHQATLLVVAATLAGARLATAWGLWPRGRRHRAITILAAAAVVALAFAALPLTGSRAGVLLFLLAAAAVAAGQWPAWRGRRGGRLLLGAGLAATAVGLLAALRWMRVDAIDELRSPLRAATAQIAQRYAPSGSGVGSYAGVFEQEAPDAMLMDTFVNHAHNEYAQWLFEAGVLALPAMALGAWALLWTARGLRRRPPHERGLGLAALVALLAILAHSLVDYPLRTPALLCVAAALAAMAASAAARGGGHAAPEPSSPGAS